MIKHGHERLSSLQQNGLAYYVFRKSQGVWELALVYLLMTSRKRALTLLYFALIRMMPELFYHHVKRQVVEVRAKKYSLWHIYLNNAYVEVFSMTPSLSSSITTLTTIAY